MTRIALCAAVFTVVAGGILAWYAFKAPEGIPVRNMVVTAYVDPEPPSGRCVRRLTLVVTALNTSRKPATVAAIRFLAGTRSSFDANVSPRRVGAGKQVVSKFDVTALYARLRSQRTAGAITRVEVRDGAGIRYLSPVALNTGARMCGR